MQGEVIITISPDGSQVEMDAKNFVGGACKDFLKSVQSALGTTIDEKKRPEFFQTGKGGVSVGN